MLFNFSIRNWIQYLLGRYRKGGGSSAFRLRNGQNITIIDDVRFTLNEIYLDRVYDVPGVDFKRCTSVLDLGANMGIFALYIASKNSGAQIHCFEPEATNFKFLQRNLSANNVRASTYPYAVSSSSGIGHLSIKGTSAEYTLASAGDAFQEVECVDIDRVFELTGVEHFDFVKMDIEGAEREILAACTDQQLRRMRAISLEWHHSLQELDDLATRLRAYGFEVQTKIVHGHVAHLRARLL